MYVMDYYDDKKAYSYLILLISNHIQFLVISYYIFFFH